MKTSIGALTLALSIVALPSHDPCAATIAPQMSCPSCEDFDSCTVDSCDTTTGTCRHDPLDCDDGNPCTADTCDSHGSIAPPRLGAGTRRSRPERGATTAPPARQATLATDPATAS